MARRGREAMKGVAGPARAAARHTLDQSNAGRLLQKFQTNFSFRRRPAWRRSPRRNARSAPWAGEMAIEVGFGEAGMIQRVKRGSVKGWFRSAPSQEKAAHWPAG